MIEVTKAEGLKCERCWRVVPVSHFGFYRAWPGICGRCGDVLNNMFSHIFSFRNRPFQMSFFDWLKYFWDYKLKNLGLRNV